MAEVCIVSRTLGWFGVELLGDVTSGEHQHTLYQMATSWVNSFIGDIGERGFYVKIGDKTYHKESGLLHTKYQMVTSWANLFIGEELTIQKFNNYLIINGSLLMISEFEWDKIVEGRVIVYLECDFKRGFG